MTPTQPGIDPATLAPGTPVEMQHDSTRGVPMLSYAYPDGWRSSSRDFYALHPWDDWRIARVLGDVTPWPEIAPEDVREMNRIRAVNPRPVGAIIEENVILRPATNVLYLPASRLEIPDLAASGWTLHVHPDDAPNPDPDADLIEAMARAAYAAGNECWAWESTTDGDRKAYLIEARAALAAVRAHDAKAGA